ncbi:hypothetical protein DFH09DRAFT_1399469 [Mycena vulgaris]|nr:hypothetical protein DFH09DRAFT_1399469 [Mycena vulgaris]
MSDPTMCRGKDADGHQCICMRSTDTHVVEGKVLCKNCGHIESAHPEPKPSTSAFVRGFRDAAKLGSTAGTSFKASKQEAEAETNQGLRKKRKSDVDTEPPIVKKSKATKPTPKKEGEVVKYGKLVFLTPGIVDGVLKEDAVPSAATLDLMGSAGLVVLSTPGKPLIMNTAWSCDRVNREIKKLLPDVIGYLEKKPYRGLPEDAPEIQKQLWMGLIRNKKHLSVALSDLPTGVELADRCKTRGVSTADRVLYLASKARVTQKRFQNWDTPPSDSESEDLGSDIDTVPSEDLVMTPRKPAPKKKKINQETAVKLEDDSDMKNAAKMRTRMSTGALKRGPSLFIPTSGDDPEEDTGSAGSSAQDVVVVSDDDDEFPPAPTLPPVTPPLSVIANLWKSPLRIDNPKSPSPAPSPQPSSPDRDPPSFYDEFPFGSPPTYITANPIATSSALPAASSSSYLSGGSSTVPAFSLSSTSTTPLTFSTPSLPSWASSSRLTDALPSNANTSVADVAPSAPRFKRMGKGRAGRDPWARTA